MGRPEGRRELPWKAASNWRIVSILRISSMATLVRIATVASFLLIGAGGVASCREPTAVRVRLRTDVPWAAGRTVILAGGANPNASEPSGEIKQWTTTDLGDLVFIPGADKSSVVRVLAIMGVDRDPKECSVAEPQGCIFSRRKLAFFQYHTLTVPITVHSACLGVPCDEDTTCNSLGQCVAAEVKPTDCASAGGCAIDGDELPTKFVDEVVDAGKEVDAGDAGVVDAGKDVDAGDADVADAGQVDAGDAGLVVVSYRTGEYETKCLDVSGGSTENGSNIVLWDCNGAPSQGWVVMADGTIRSAMDLTKCLYAPNTDIGTQLQIWDCNGAPSQGWVPMPDNTIRYTADTNLCVDLWTHNILNGNRVNIYTCNGGLNQVWIP